MILRLFAPLGALLVLAACSSTPEPPPGGPGGPPGGISSSRFGPGSQQDLAATAGDRVFFAYDRSDISSEAQQILQRQAQWLKRYPNVSVTIEGHTDERGTREYNLALGERRAQAVKNVLTALGDIPENSLDFYIENFDYLANLQLLEGLPNIEKSNTDFKEWLFKMYPSKQAREAYMERNFIPDVDLSFTNFEEFLEERKKLMAAQFNSLLKL